MLFELTRLTLLCMYFFATHVHQVNLGCRTYDVESKSKPYVSKQNLDGSKREF